MKQNILIICLIIFSLIGGGIGSLAVSHFLHSDISEKNQTNVEQPKASKREISRSLKSLESEITSTVENIAPSIVSIVVNKDLMVYRSDPWGFFHEPTGSVRRKVGGGSGFFIRKDGTILTNKHVVSDPNADYTVILSNGDEYEANVLALDPINDLAVIKIEDEQQDFSPLEVHENIKDIQIGQFSIAVGNALAEFQNSVSLGIVSGIDRSIEAGGDKLTGLIQTDTAINPGNSGGPLLSLEGKVLGINTAIASGSNGIGFSFALSKDRIDYILESIEKYGRIKRPFIGISYIPNSPALAQRLERNIDYGVYVAELVEGSSAQESGIKTGDIITEINGEKAYNELLGKTIQNSLPGDTLLLTLEKESGKTETVGLELGEY